MINSFFLLNFISPTASWVDEISILWTGFFSQLYHFNVEPKKGFMKQSLVRFCYWWVAVSLRGIIWGSPIDCWRWTLEKNLQLCCVVYLGCSPRFILLSCISKIYHGKWWLKKVKVSLPVTTAVRLRTNYPSDCLVLNLWNCFHLVSTIFGWL